MRTGWSDEDSKRAYDEGFGIGQAGTIYEISNFRAELLSTEKREWIIQKAEAGDEFYQHALAVAAHRRMTW